MMSYEVVERIGQRADRDTRSRHRSSAFSLVELLVVIGIIALLLTAVFTAVAKVRSAGKRTQCLSNLRTIGAAMHQYLIDNNDTFPLAASNMGHKEGDFLYWQAQSASGGPPIDMVGIGGIGHYISSLDDLSPGGLQALRCPADDRLDGGGYLGNPHQPSYPTGYPFSYVISAFMVSGNYGDAGPDSSTIARTFTKVKEAAAKIMVYEEDARTINDGVGNLQPNLDKTNLLSVRHDVSEPLSVNAPNRPDAPIKVIVLGGPPPTFGTMNHIGSSGNVLFADGHAESVPRGFAHMKAHYAPDENAAALMSMP